MAGKKIAVIGAGSWGTALALLLSENNDNVVLWVRNEKTLRDIQQNRINERYLSGVYLPQNIKLVSELKEAVEGATMIVMVVPSHCYRQVFQEVAPFIYPGCFIVSAVKGIENSSMQTMTQIMLEIYGSTANKDCKFGVLSGPSFAEEVSRKVPTAVTIGFADIEVAKKVQKIFGTDYFRVYASNDIVGLEISASIKNVIAIAAGICDGLGYGLNTRAALITRGLAEMQRLGTALGADPATFSGLSGLGDLLLTCTGDLSRNRTVGLKLGKGKNIQQIKNEMNMVAEGIKTTLSVYELAQDLKIEMPILEQIYKIIYQDKDCARAVEDLLKRDLTTE